MTFADSVLKLETVLRPHNEVGFTPPDTGEVYDLTTPPEPSEPFDEPSLILVAESIVKNTPAPVVENTSSSSTRWAAARWDWEVLFNRSIMSALLLLILMAAVAFTGLRWYNPGSPQQQQAVVQQAQQVAGEGAEQQRQNVEVRDEQVELLPFADIFEAAARGTVEDIRFFLDRRNINQTDERGWTPLHYAAEHNPNAEVMRFLIAQGAGVNVKNNEGWTPLDIAHRDEIRVVLREAGAMPYQSPFENIFDAALHGTVQDVAFFVNNGADVNQKDNEGRTPLHCAAWVNPNVHVVKYLVSQGADLNVKDNIYQNTLLLTAACANSNVAVFEYLVLQGANINDRNPWGSTPLHHVAEYNSSVEVLKHLVSVRDVDINAKDNNGRTALDRATTEEKRAILRAAGGRSGQ